MSEAVQLAPDEPLVAPAAQEPVKPAEAVEQTAETPAESATEASSGEEKPATETPPEKPEETAKKSSSRFERKINRLYREAAEQKARADLLEQRLNEAARTQTPQQDPGAPRLEQFDYDPEKYAQAVADYKLKVTAREHEARQRAAAQQASLRALSAGWEAKTAAAETKYEDYDEIVGELKPTTPWAIAIMRAENGDDVAYHLGKNLAEAKRIMALDPQGQFLEIGRLSAKLQMQPAAPKTPSKAPAPITPVSGKAGGGSDLPQDTDDIATWMKKENARMRKSAGR